MWILITVADGTSLFYSACNGSPFTALNLSETNTYLLSSVI